MYKEQIGTGADILDQVRPGWPLLIDPLRLDMQNFYTDVLGQLFGDYFRGMDAIKDALFGKNAPVGHEKDLDPPSSAWGFTVGDWRDLGPVGDAKYAQLTNEWRAFIKSRQVELEGVKG